MRMHILTFFILLLFSQNAIGQDIWFQVHNEEPRVGQTVELSIDNARGSKKITQHFDQFLREQVKSNPAINSKLKVLNHEKALLAVDTGSVTLGPYSFQYKGKDYSTNRVHLNIIEPLGDKEGFWIRKINMHDKEYLLLEQIILFKETQRPIVEQYTYVEDTTLVRLQVPDTLGFDLKLVRAATHGMPNRIKSYPIASNNHVALFEIEKRSDFKGPVILKKEYFLYLPKDAELPIITIQ